MRIINTLDDNRLMHEQANRKAYLEDALIVGLTVSLGFLIYVLAAI